MSRKIIIFIGVVGLAVALTVALLNLGRKEEVKEVRLKEKASIIEPTKKSVTKGEMGMGNWDSTLFSLEQANRVGVI